MPSRDALTINGESEIDPGALPPIENCGSLSSIENCGSLSSGEARLFAENEAIVRAHLRTFFAVGIALHLISDRRWYRARGYSTFADYCLGEWRMGDKYAYRLMAAAEAVAGIAEAEGVEISPYGDNLAALNLPTSEAVARPLTHVDPSDGPIVWELAKSNAADRGREAPTARDVESAVAGFAGSDRSPRPKDEPLLIPDEPTFHWREISRLIFQYRDGNGARTAFADVEKIAEGGKPPRYTVAIGGEHQCTHGSREAATRWVESRLRDSAGLPPATTTTPLGGPTR